MIEPIAGIVVAGGKSYRLGHDKRTLRLWGNEGPTLLEHTLHVLAQVCQELVVVLNDPHNWSFLPALLVSDTYADGGALGGISTGLDAIVSPRALVVATDMPLLQVRLLQAMAHYSASYDALVPYTPLYSSSQNTYGLEPLHAIYRRTCCAPLHAALDRGVRRITDFLATIETTRLNPDMLRRYDPDGLSFLNINRPDDLAAVSRVIRGESYVRI